MGFPSKEKAIRVGAGPTERNLKGVMKLGEGGAATNPHAAPEVRAGVADDDAKLIHFGGGCYVAHVHKQRSLSPVSFHELLDPPLIIFGFHN